MWADKKDAPSEFVTRLYRMLDTPEFQDIVAWSDKRNSFVISDMRAFQEQVLTEVFNHSNYSSFVRQLNKYDFHKVRSQDPKSQKCEFRHPDFRPENEERSHLIKRKLPSARSSVTPFPGTVNELQAQIIRLQTRVDEIESANKELWQMVNTHRSLLRRLVENKAPERSSTTSPPIQVLNKTDGLHQHAPSALLAMDDDESRAICAKFLQEYGCIVTPTNNGSDALKFVKENFYEYIVLDLVLAEIDGLYITDVIRTADQLVPIILFVDADEGNIPIADYLEKGVTAVLQRPFTKRMLFEVLNTWAERP